MRFLFTIIILSTLCLTACKTTNRKNSSVYNNELSNMTKAKHRKTKPKEADLVKILQQHPNIGLMINIPQSLCHIHVDENKEKDFQKELGFNENVSNFIASTLRQALKGSRVQVHQINPESFFPDLNVWFNHYYKESDRLKAKPAIRDQFVPLMNKLYKEKDVALVLYLWVNDYTHGKNHQDKCYGLRFATKNLPNKKPTYVHVPRLVVFSTKTGKNIAVIQPDKKLITNAIEYPKDFNHLDDAYVQKIITIMRQLMLEEMQLKFNPRKVTEK